MDPMNTRIENDLRALRDDELDIITGGADTQTEQKTFSTLSSAASTVIKAIGDGLKSIARP
jgi:hypothetical protein